MRIGSYFLIIIIFFCCQNSEESQILIPQNSITKETKNKSNPKETLKIKRQELRMKSDSLSDSRIHLKRYYKDSRRWHKEEFLIEKMGEEILLQNQEWGLQDCSYPGAITEKWQHPILKKPIHFLLFTTVFDKKNIEKWDGLEKELDKRIQKSRNSIPINQNIRKTEIQEEFRKIEFFKDGEKKFDEIRQVNEDIIFDSLCAEILKLFK